MPSAAASSAAASSEAALSRRAMGSNWINGVRPAGTAIRVRRRRPAMLRAMSAVTVCSGSAAAGSGAAPIFVHSPDVGAGERRSGSHPIHQHAEQPLAVERAGQPTGVGLRPLQRQHQWDGLRRLVQQTPGEPGQCRGHLHARFHAPDQELFRLRAVFRRRNDVVLAADCRPALVSGAVVVFQERTGDLQPEVTARQFVNVVRVTALLRDREHALAWRGVGFEQPSLLQPGERRGKASAHAGLALGWQVRDPLRQVEGFRQGDGHQVQAAGKTTDAAAHRLAGLAVAVEDDGCGLVAQRPGRRKHAHQRA